MNRIMPCSRMVGLTACALGLLWLAGCGGGRAYDGPQRAPVEGTVTLDGEPVDGGTINFMPLDGGGRTASALIKDGRYEIPEERGPTLGRYRVEITWNKPTEPVDEENPDAPVKTEQAVPAKYNKETTLEEEIQPDKNELNYELTSD